MKWTTRRIRFSMASLLVVTTTIVLFLGYAQWRRQWILNECEYVKNQGIEIAAPNNWTDVIWQRMPETAILNIRSEKKFVSQSEAHRLARLGVQNIVVPGPKHPYEFVVVIPELD